MCMHINIYINILVRYIFYSSKGDCLAVQGFPWEALLISVLGFPPPRNGGQISVCLGSFVTSPEVKFCGP